jgi:hypothetical protein
MNHTLNPLLFIARAGVVMSAVILAFELVQFVVPGIPLPFDWRGTIGFALGSVVAWVTRRRHPNSFV